MKYKEWRELIRNLRKHFPPVADVKVYRHPIKKYFGLTTWDGRTFKIYVDSKQDYSNQVHTLLHEWGHVTAISDSYTHSETWGILYGRIYEAWNKEFK